MLISEKRDGAISLREAASSNQGKYPNQQIIVVEINEYAYLVPFVESSKGKFLKTIIPSRKATRDYLGGKNEQDKTG